VHESLRGFNKTALSIFRNTVNIAGRSIRRNYNAHSCKALQ